MHAEYLAKLANIVAQQNAVLHQLVNMIKEIPTVDNNKLLELATKIELALQNDKLIQEQITALGQRVEALEKSGSDVTLPDLGDVKMPAL